MYTELSDFCFYEVHISKCSKLGLRHDDMMCLHTAGDKYKELRLTNTARSSFLWFDTVLTKPHHKE